MSEPLTGAFLDIAVVEDYGETEEEETLLDRTTEDVEIERDPEEIDWEEHNNPHMQRREGAETATMTFEMVVTDDQQNLVDAGIIDETSGEALRNVIHEAVYIHIYLNENDEEPSATYFAEDVQFVYEQTNLPISDVGTVEVSGWIHGSHGYKQEE